MVTVAVTKNPISCSAWISMGRIRRVQPWISMREFEDCNNEFWWMSGKSFGLFFMEIATLNFDKREENLKRVAKLLKIYSKKIDYRLGNFSVKKPKFRPKIGSGELTLLEEIFLKNIPYFLWFYGRFFSDAIFFRFVFVFFFFFFLFYNYPFLIYLSF